MWMHHAKLFNWNSDENEVLEIFVTSGDVHPKWINYPFKSHWLGSASFTPHTTVLSFTHAINSTRWKFAEGENSKCYKGRQTCLYTACTQWPMCLDHSSPTCVTTDGSQKLPYESYRRSCKVNPNKKKKCEWPSTPSRALVDLVPAGKETTVCLLADNNVLLVAVSRQSWSAAACLPDTVSLLTLASFCL